MKEFLKSVAEHYFAPIAQRPAHEQDWTVVTDYLFVFPSRRSGLFFSQYLYDVRNADINQFAPGKDGKPSKGIPVFSPHTTTIADLFSCFTETLLADHTWLLFELYKVYNQVMADEARKARERGEGNEIFVQEDFDSFIFWGEMLLNDFSDVDRYLADARQLFHNVRDLKEIEESMGGPYAGLSDEALEVIRSFWKNIDPARHGGEVKGAFHQTWSVLYEVYTRFRETLREQGIGYDGMRQREVVEAIPSGALDVYLERLPKHIVFVGITAINEAERALLKWLQKMGRAEFCWDYADPNLKAEGKDHRYENQAHASFFTRRNLQDFPNAMRDEELDPYLVPEEKRQIERIPVPSGVGQTTEAARILRKWGKEDAIHTAVVLADENLLIPMCYSVPAEFGTFNVTMGYSLRSTQAYALVESLSELQNNYRAQAHTFFFKSVLAVLGHSYLMNLEPDAASKLIHEIQKEGLFQVPEKRLRDASPLFDLVFRPAQTLPEAQRYLEQLFAYLVSAEQIDEEEIGTENPTEKNGIGDLERESLLCYAEQLSMLSGQIVRSTIPEKQLSRHTLFRLLQRLAGSQRVSFSGEPLSGLQVMGVLETRALDFERIVILSMNEGVFPAKPSMNTFIPSALRNAFGLPTQRHKDAVLAYHFYRLLSRAKQVSLLFDSRRTGMKSGEESRYLLQLKYLSKSNVEDCVVEQSIPLEEPEPIAVQKTADILKKMEAFQVGKGQRRISASSLKQYVSCPLQFYFAQVERLRENDDISEELGDNQFGDLLHVTMENLYKEALGKRLLSDNIKNLMKGNAIDDAIEKAFRKVLNGAEKSGYFELVLRLVRQYVEGILKYDAQQVPMTYLASEGEQVVPYEVSPDLQVNLKAVYDRIDIVTDEQGRGLLRVVDYKTGSTSKKLEMSDMAALFQSDGKGSKEALQVLFYCLMLKYASQQTLIDFNLYPPTSENAYQVVQPHLYFTRNFVRQGGEIKTQITSSEYGIIDNFEKVSEEFEKELKRLITEIFNPEVPFTQCSNSRTCKYCPFIKICGR